MQVQGDGDLAGGGVVPFAVAVAVAGFAHHRAGHEPVGQPALQPRRHGQPPAAGFAVGLGEGRPGGGDVAAVAIDHEDALKAMAGQ